MNYHIAFLIGLILFLPLKLSATTCGIDGHSIINRLAEMRPEEINGKSLLDELLGQKKTPPPTVTNEDLLITRKESLNKLLADNDASPVEIYQLKNEVSRLELNSRPAGVQTAVNDSLTNSIPIPLSRNVIKQMEKDGLSKLDILMIKLKAGDSYSVWLPGGRFAEAKVIKASPDVEGFVIVEYFENGVKIRGSKPIEYLSITPSKKKEAQAYFEKEGKRALEETTSYNRSANKIVDDMVKDAFKDPQVEKLKSQIDEIYKKDGLDGMLTDEYQRLQKELAKAQSPYIPLTKDEIETVFAPLSVIGTKKALGKGDLNLISKAEEILQNKKRHYPEDDEYRRLLEEVKNGPARFEKEKQKIVREKILKMTRPSTFTENQILKEFPSLKRSEIEQFQKITTTDPYDLDSNPRRELRNFLEKISRGRNPADAPSPLYEYLQTRGNYYLEFFE